MDIEDSIDYFITEILFLSSDNQKKIFKMIGNDCSFINIKQFMISNMKNKYEMNILKYKVGNILSHTMKTLNIINKDILNYTGDEYIDTKKLYDILNYLIVLVEYCI